MPLPDLLALCNSPIGGARRGIVSYLLKEKNVKTKLGSVTVLLICFAMACATPYGVAQTKDKDKAKDRPTISAGERALAMLEVQNTMSKHAFFHSAGKNYEELDAIWVKKTPGATFSNPRGSWVEIENIRASYGEANRDNQKKSMEALAKKYPEIKVSPESLGVGEWLIHTLTTPIVEVAGDGKTAKAMWYSPGAMVGAKPDGTASGTWFFEKYGVDFVKEDGQWRIWHIQMFYDLTGPLEKGLADVPVRAGGPREAAERPAEDPRMKMQKSQPNPYKDWSPTTVPTMVRFPEPYYTFSETFSY
jgi:hypothetical protein